VNDEGKKSGHLSVVAEGDPEKARRDFERDRIRSRIEWSICELAANLLRVIAGAGKSYDLIEHMVAVIEACDEFNKTGGYREFGTSFSEIVERVLREGTDTWLQKMYDRGEELSEQDRANLDRWSEDGSVTRELGQTQMVQSALRMVAGRLVEQRVQVSQAESQFWDGFRAIERSREEKREYHARDGQRPTFSEILPRGKRSCKEQGKAEASRPVVARPPTKTIGIYDALEEQQARERAAKAKNEKP
jgi:hypothetical protein